VNYHIFKKNINWKHQFYPPKDQLPSSPALCPIYGWQVTTLWVNCPLWVRQLGQLSLPSLQSNHEFIWITEWRLLERQIRATYDCRPKSASGA